MPKPYIYTRKKDGELHIEGTGFIVNITAGLHDKEGRGVTRIEVLADGDRYQGEPQWWLEGAKLASLSMRVIQTNTPADYGKIHSFTRDEVRELRSGLMLLNRWAGNEAIIDNLLLRFPNPDETA